jgi:phospholipase C
LRPITQGDNQPSGSAIGYAAGNGWNACTGLGVPIGQALFAALTLPAGGGTTSGSPGGDAGGGMGGEGSGQTGGNTGLGAIDHIVTLMLENRSFDHMLGYLYADQNNVAPSGQPFDGLTGQESNKDAQGKAHKVFAIKPNAARPYLMPGTNPAEGYAATNAQLFDQATAPNPPAANNSGFVTSFASTITAAKQKKRPIESNTSAGDIMGCYAPETLPVLSGLARGFAVCDRWFGSAPTETLPNRAFACAATSQGHMDDVTKSFTVPSIFGLMSQHGLDWAIYGYDAPPLTRHDFPDTLAADDGHFGQFKDFQAAAANGKLPAYTFLEPSWGSDGNSQHPNYDVALGEQLIHDVYYALRNGPAWNKTLLIITYDEHGGCYDHVPAPVNAAAPDASPGEFGFDFRRFGPRVPAVLVSPLIPAGSVLKPPGATPFDHTSILKTIEARWSLPPLTLRDAAAPELSSALSLAQARSDDPLAGVVVPVSQARPAAAGEPSHLQRVFAELVARLPVDPAHGGVEHEPPLLATGADYRRYVNDRVAAWQAVRHKSPQHTRTTAAHKHEDRPDAVGA